MSPVDAAAVLTAVAAVVTLLALTPQRDGLVYLLAFPIWIVARDLGVVAGAAAGVGAFLFVILGAAQGIVLGPVGYLGCAAVFLGTIAAGAQAVQRRGAGQRQMPLLPVLRTRPEIGRGAGGLSRRELQVLDLIATGANNAEIADRLVISLNTVKSHVGRILQKLPAANRTRAAFRYIELYGAPAGANGHITAASATNAAVSARRDDEVALRLQDGRDLEVPLLEQLSERVDVGDSAIVYFDHFDRVIGWYLPDEELGVDLRRWTP